MTNGYRGKVGRTTRDSIPHWADPPRAKETAPNIIVMVVDDLGYSDIGPYGSEIETPYLNSLASKGVVMSNYHSAPVCSPARAALLTGLNPHRAGYATVANRDLGFPNTAMEIAEDVSTLPEDLRANGYSTLAVGKWHLTRSGLFHDAGSRHSFPLARGFDSFYGSMEGMNNFFHPNRLVRDNSVIEVDDRGDNYYLTDDFTDQAISMVKRVRASGAKPFFLYFAHQAVHGPIGAKPQDIAKYRGKYDRGWDLIREERFARQIELGLLPPDTDLPGPEPRERHAVPAWSSLAEEQRARYARYMEVYAAMVDNIDQNLGRLLSCVEDMGELDNTIVVFTSDNGGTMEAGETGTRSYFSQFLPTPGLPANWDRDVPRDLNLIGGPQLMAHYPRGWGRVSNTPFRLFKAHAFAGGVRVPFILSSPRGDSGLRNQFQYVTDVFPTLLELSGSSPQVTRNGYQLQARDGRSFAPVLEDAQSFPTRTEQYSEFGGQRGFYRDGWKLLTNHDPGADYIDKEWELYDVVKDPTETVNLRDKFPEKLHELAAGWEAAAVANQVFPLDAGEGYSAIAHRPSEEKDFSKSTQILSGTFTLERHRSSRLIALRSFEILIELRQHSAGDEGVLVSHGDQGGGYLLFVENDRLNFAYNAYGVMHYFDASFVLNSAQRVVVRAEVCPEFTWSFQIAVSSLDADDFDEVVIETPPVPMLVGAAPFSGIDVGIMRGGPVCWELYRRRRSFPYTGELRAVTYFPKEVAPYDPALLFDLAQSAARIED